MIQGVVNRLSNNSFLLKGWSVILISGLFALAAKDSKPLFVYIAYFPCFTFWLLDGYFLWQERLFRALYDKVRVIDSSAIDYSMNTSMANASGQSWLGAVFSRTLIAFHGSVFGTVVIVMLVMAKA